MKKKDPSVGYPSPIFGLQERRTGGLRHSHCMVEERKGGVLGVGECRRRAARGEVVVSAEKRKKKSKAQSTKKRT